MARWGLYEDGLGIGRGWPSGKSENKCLNKAWRGLWTPPFIYSSYKRTKPRAKELDRTIPDRYACQDIVSLGLLPGPKVSRHLGKAVCEAESRDMRRVAENTHSSACYF